VYWGLGIRPLAKVTFALLREKGKGFLFLFPFPYFCKKSIRKEEAEGRRQKFLNFECVNFELISPLPLCLSGAGFFD
jgi:hypothetical protein